MDLFVTIVLAVLAALVIWKCLPYIILVVAGALTLAYVVIATAVKVVALVIATPFIWLGRGLAWATRPIHPLFSWAFKALAGLD